MYKSFRVQNYRCFADLELNDLARINLIAGKNNTGKTSLLEAIGIHAGIGDLIGSRMGAESGYPGRYAWGVLFFGFRVSQPITFSGHCPEKHDYQTLEISIPTDATLTRQEAQEILPLIYKNGHLPQYREIQVLQFTPDKRSPWSMVYYQGKIFPTRLTPMPPVPAIFVSDRRPDFLADGIILFSQLKQSRQTDFLVSAIQKLEPRLTDLHLLAEGLYGDIGLNELVPLSAMGGGMVCLTGIILAISDVENGVIFIDEIENGLHYSVQVDVWKAIAKAARDFNVQIFATTHSLEMIRAAHEAFKDDDPYDFRLHRLDRSPKTGKISAVTYDRDLLEAAAEANFEVR